MTNVSAVEKMAELMQQMEENSPRVAAFQYCLKQVAEKVEEAEKRNAELQARCAALAAENAGLKVVCEDRRTFIMNGVQLGYIQVPTVETDPALETIRVAVSPQEPTPATDAFLAEVRALARNDLIDELEARFTELSKTSPTPELRSGAAGAAGFVSTFRKGAQS